MPPKTPHNPQIRPALPSDLDSLTTTLIQGMEHDPIFPYRYPSRHEYADEYFAYERAHVAKMLRNERLRVCVYVDDEDGDGEGEVKGMAIWDVPPSLSALFSPTTPTSAPSPEEEGDEDLDPATMPTPFALPSRMNAFTTSHSAAKTAHFDAPLGADSHLYLAILCVHPSHQRRGVGRAMVRYGIERARDGGMKAVSVYGSPMGRRLYASLGFERVGSFRVQVDGEGEFVDEVGMVLRL